MRHLNVNLYVPDSYENHSLLAFFIVKPTLLLKLLTRYSYLLYSFRHEFDFRNIRRSPFSTKRTLPVSDHFCFVILS